MNNDIYKSIKTQELIEGFKDFIPKLKEKYNEINFNISIDYEIISIAGDKLLEKYINSIIEDIISYTKNNLDEEYNVITEFPAERSYDPNFPANYTEYTYSLFRKLKEGEEE